jgi:uncharacterized protein YycO
MKELNRCDLIFVQPTDFIGKAIAWVTRSNDCHVAVVISKSFIIEAAWSGVRLARIDSYNNFEVFRYINVLSDEQSKSIIDFSYSKIGEWYDFGGALYLGWLWLTRQSKKINQLNDPDRWFCSELVVAAFRSAGIDLCPGIPAADVDPGTLSQSALLKKIS